MVEYHETIPYEHCISMACKGKKTEEANAMPAVETVTQYAISNYTYPVRAFEKEDDIGKKYAELQKSGAKYYDLEIGNKVDVLGEDDENKEGKTIDAMLVLSEERKH